MSVRDEMPLITDELLGRVISVIRPKEPGAVVIWN